MSKRTGSIRELEARKTQLQREYHEAVRALDAEIAEIRKARGTKLKEYIWEGYREPGRSQQFDNLGRRLY